MRRTLLQIEEKKRINSVINVFVWVVPRSESFLERINVKDALGLKELGPRHINRGFTKWTIDENTKKTIIDMNLFYPNEVVMFHELFHVIMILENKR